MRPRHDWDSDVHRDLIHATFDKWFVAYTSGARAAAGHYRWRLARLCDQAEARRQLLETNRAALILPIPHEEPR